MTRKASPVAVGGPLAGHASGLQAALISQGYTALSAADLVRVLAHLSTWLQRQGLGAEDLTVEQVEAFVAARRAEGRVRRISVRGVEPVLGYLRACGAAPPPPPEALPVTPVDAVLVWG